METRDIINNPLSEGRFVLATAANNYSPSAIVTHGAPLIKPETFRLPAKGGDPFFGMTRSWYYAAEADGRLRLIRIRKRGNQRGVTLVPYDAVRALVFSETMPPSK